MPKYPQLSVSQKVMGSTPLLLSEGDCLPHGTKEEYPCATYEHTK